MLAFKFLRVNLYLQSEFQNAYHIAILQLQEISDIARQTGDAAICTVAALMKALLHLQSRKSGSLMEAQSALAIARAQQQTKSFDMPGQLHVLSHMIDLSCSLEPFDPQLAKSKMAAMHQLMDQVDKDAPWQKDGSFSVPLSPRHNNALLKDTGGVFSRASDGSYGMQFSWMGRVEAYALGYSLSAAATTFPSTTSTGSNTSEAFLLEAQKMSTGKTLTSYF